MTKWLERAILYAMQRLLRFSKVWLFISLFPLALSSQIVAPEFICVKNDTLFWNASVNNCGPFRGYRIFISQNKSGPYTLLTTIANPGQTSFFHANAGSGQRFYYLQSDYDCPGQTPLSSDTLDNRIPEAGLIRYVTVTGNAVEIGWEKSPSPEVFAYIVSKSTPAGTVTLDTVFSKTTYIDTSARPGERTETYFVVAIDRCGNNSLVPPPHTTMRLEATAGNACNRQATLRWNLYRNWVNPIQKHEIWVSENGTAPRSIGEAAANATTFTFQNANASIRYCFTVRAIESVRGNVASSNEVCLTLDVIPTVTELILTNATVSQDNRVNLTWRWNANAAIEKLDILRGTGGTNAATIFSAKPPQPLRRENDYQDNNGNPAERALIYQLQTTDACNAVVKSNTLTTIFLQAQRQGSPVANRVRWSAYQNQYAGEIIYELYRQTTIGAPELLANIGGNTALEYLDAAGEGNACYFAIAKTTLTLPNGELLPVESRSNIACAAEELRLYIPNVFAPAGTNNEFKPILPFGQLAEYSLIIFNRWGEKVFESRNIDAGWDGKIGSYDAPQGVYAYYIRLATAEGQRGDYAGLVTLLR